MASRLPKKLLLNDFTPPCVPHLGPDKTYFIAGSGEAWRIYDLYFPGDGKRHLVPIGAPRAQFRTFANGRGERRTHIFRAHERHDQG